MPAATPARAAAWLRHAVLLAALLAVIAGFLGMHVLSGSHGMHSQAPLSGAAGHRAGTRRGTGARPGPQHARQPRRRTPPPVRPAGLRLITGSTSEP